jgi:hypothetical protein
MASNFYSYIFKYIVIGDTGVGKVRAHARRDSQPLADFLLMHGTRVYFLSQSCLLHQFTESKCMCRKILFFFFFVCIQTDRRCSLCAASCELQYETMLCICTMCVSNSHPRFAAHHRRRVRHTNCRRCEQENQIANLGHRWTGALSVCHQFQKFRAFSRR